MIKLIWTVVLVLFMSTIANSQNDSIIASKFKLSRLDAGIGIYNAAYNGKVHLYEDQYHSGFGTFVEVSGSIKNHIFSLGIMHGSEVTFFGGKPQGYYSFDLYYERELNIWSWFTIQIGGGLGAYAHRRRVVLSETDQSGSIIGSFEVDYRRQIVMGAPFRIKLLVKISDTLSWGIQPGVNFNSINTTYTGNLILRYRILSKNK